MFDTHKGIDTISLFCRLYINNRRELPIRASEMGLLIYLVQTKSPQTPLQASNFFKVGKSMITAMITPLTKKGYLDKLPCPTDGRSYLLSPTAKTIALVEETYAEYTKTIEYLEQNLGATKYNQLLSLLDEANTLLLEGRQNG